MSDFVNIAQDLNVTVQSASYLTSLFIVILGAAPLFWRPLSQAYGRRPVFLISLIGSLIGNVGCALSPSFGTMALCRAITAFFISPAASIGSQVVSETFFKAERARYMGIWTVMVTLGVPAAPFIFGLAGFGQAYRWIYWILAMVRCLLLCVCVCVCVYELHLIQLVLQVNAVQFILYFLFGPESRYIRGSFRPDDGSWLRQRLLVRRIDPSPITLSTFIHPLSLTGRIRVLLPAISHSMVFLWGSVATTFEIPQIYPRQFHFTERQVGLQFIAVLVGTVLGEQLGGFLSDKWMVYGRNLHGKKHNDEFRLWLAYPGQILTIVGTVMFFVLLGGAKAWTVTPVVGAGISAAGNQIVTTTMITYAVDCYPQDSAAVGVIIVLIRQTWGFIGPFWLVLVSRQFLQLITFY